MKSVKVRRFASTEQFTMTLAGALEPTVIFCSGGELERIEAQVEENTRAIGRLLAHFVETEAMSIDTAREIAHDNLNDKWVIGEQS